MVPQRKIFTVENLAEKFNQAKALILADYRGLNVSQMAELRGAIKKAGGEFEVVKNTLLRLAAESSKFKVPFGPSSGRGQSSKLSLTGPTAALWIYKDDPSPLKILNDFIQKSELSKSGACSSRIKLGFWDKRLLSLEEILLLANLPGPQDLKAKLVGLLQSPASRLVNVFNWNLYKLVYILERESKRKGE